MPILSAPVCNRPKRPALPVASGLVHHEPLSFAGSAPVMGKAQEVEGFGFRLTSVLPSPRSCESHYSSLFQVDLKAVFFEAPGQHLIDPLSIFFLLEAHHKVSSPGEFHPKALSEPYVNLSAHTAPAMEPRRTPICQCANNPGSRREIRAIQCVARRKCPRSFLYFL
jgi:hypothetical protein